MQKGEKYQICNRCVMDNASDSTITFDNTGNCNYCNKALDDLDTNYFPHLINDSYLNRLLEKIKNAGRNKDFDCIMGLSGGLDSSYLAYLGAKKWNLRIKAVHIDDGFNTDLAVQNIKNLCDSCKIDLITIKPDSDQFRSLTKAFFRAEVPNIAIPQDNILLAILYDFANKHKIKYFLSGYNLSLESILQRDNTYTASDLYHIRQINKLFGSGPIDKLPFISPYKRDWYKFINNIQTEYPLNYIEYKKNEAIDELVTQCNYKYYDAKHLENDLTKIIQLLWFARKFNVDKRKSHLSSLIMSRQLTRKEALEELNNPLYNDIEEDIIKVCTKLNLPVQEFHALLERPGFSHRKYPTDKYFYPLYSRFFSGLNKLNKIYK